MNAWYLGEHQVKFGKYFKYFPPLKKELTSSLRFYQAVGPRGSWPLRPWGPGTVPPDSPPQDVPAGDAGTLPEHIARHSFHQNRVFVLFYPNITYWPCLSALRALPPQQTYLVAILKRGLPSYRNVDSVEKCWPGLPTAPRAPAGAERSAGTAPACAQRGHTAPPAYS